MTSISTPTAMNDTMRSMPATRDRSTRKSFTTTTAMSAAPVIHSARRATRVAYTMVASASTDQKIDSDACAITERRTPEKVYGTSAQWCRLRSSTPLSQAKAMAPATIAQRRETASDIGKPLRRMAKIAAGKGGAARTCARAGGLGIGRDGGGGRGAAGGGV